MVDKLKKIQSIAKNIGYNVELHTKNKEITQDFLQVSFKDKENNIQSISVLFSPLSDDFKTNDVLTFYYQLPFENIQISNELLTLVFYMNGRLPIGHFNIQNDKVQLRHNCMIDKKNFISEQSFQEMLVVYIGEIITYAKVVSDFIQKKISLQESFNQIS